MSDIIPAATAVVIREAGETMEALLLKRKSKGGNGAWVFPGGKVDHPDQLGAADELEVAVRAACRETREEAGIDLDAEALQMISHWTTPKEAPKRFSTWFFIVPCPGQPIEVDDVEIMDFRWVQPAEALIEHSNEALKLVPPTLVTLTELASLGTVNAAHRYYAQRSVPWIAPRMAMQDDRIAMLYDGDAGYETSQLDAEGPRNRTWLRGQVWEYESSALSDFTD